MYKYNGEYWYKAPPLYKRIRSWFIWIGGWEKPNLSGWKICKIRYRLPSSTTKEEILKHENNINNLSTNKEIKEYLKNNGRKTIIFNSPTPISLFGHRISIYNFGIDIKIKGGYLCIHKTYNKKRKFYCYISEDGTPSKAYAWYYGTPTEILKKIKVI